MQTNRMPFANHATPSLTLSPDGRSLTYGAKQLRLSGRQYALAELFTSYAGEIVERSVIEECFRSAGKSTSQSAIYFALFEFRLKIDMLTNHEWLLESVYGRGYVLRRRVRCARSMSRGITIAA